MLVKSDPLSAVNIYCKFPVSDNPTFDDAFIFGEIVRLLMKSEQYDDPRLAPNMISWGRVMGIGEYRVWFLYLDYIPVLGLSHTVWLSRHELVTTWSARTSDRTLGNFIFTSKDLSSFPDVILPNFFVSFK